MVQIQSAAELHYFEHCYQEHFVSIPLELMLVHATKFCEWQISSTTTTDTLYIVQLLYNKKQYNLKMANTETETCSCWQPSVPPVDIINIVVFWLYVCHICDLRCVTKCHGKKKPLCYTWPSIFAGEEVARRLTLKWRSCTPVITVVSFTHSVFICL